MLTMTPDIVFFFASQGSFGLSFEKVFFSASKLVIDCGRRVRTSMLLIQNEMHLLNALVLLCPWFNFFFSSLKNKIITIACASHEDH